MSTNLPVAASQPPSDRVYFPGLNGIRALAAFSVLIAHTYEFKWRMGIVLPPDYPRFLFTGLHAVIIFFVLSGFLITYLLLVEIHKTGTVSVPKFYLRRALRIWPVYYVTVFFGLIVIPLIVQASGFTGVFVPEQINGIQWVLYLLLAPNAVGFFGTPSSITAQLWSIGIEEQFYIIWPVLSKIFARRMLVALIGVIAFKVFIMNYQQTIVVDNNLPLWYRNFIAFVNNLRFENMAVGGLGAYILFHRHWLLKLIYHPLVEKLALLLVAYIALFFDHWDDPRVNILLTIPFIIFIMNVCSNPRSTLKLENRLFNWLGQISYGIYMYHLGIVYLVMLFFTFVDLSNWNGWVFNILLHIIVIGLTLAVSEASRRWFEGPFLRLKSRFTIVKSGLSVKEDPPQPAATDANLPVQFNK